jgi:energy-coupling factor transport system ATP-binding protein
MDAIRFDNVSVTFDDRAGPVLSGVDLAIDQGELVLVVGRTGSGKSTLLGAINGLVPHFTGGRLDGRVLVQGLDTRDHRPRDLAAHVGMVGQDPLAGFVTDTVEEELAYGMEQLGLPAATMRKRVEETLDLLGITDLRNAPLRDLSGGQQQRVAIGSVLTTHPKVLVLDEPTSALDPTGAEEVLAAVTRLVHDLAVTVVMAEHRVERVLQYADSVVHVADGRVGVGMPADVMTHSTIAPPVVELGRWAGWSPLPMSVRDAYRRAGDLRDRLPVAPVADDQVGANALQATDIVVRYGAVTAVDHVTLAPLRAGEITALMGRNGSGKSSLMWALQGTGTRTAGRVDVNGRDPRDLGPDARRSAVGLVPQTPADLLYLPSVAEERAQADRETGAATGSCRALLDRVVPGVPDETHPRDLSEGQRLALVLAIQLTARPAVLLLDEPTRGLDYAAKSSLAGVPRELADAGMSVLLSTHDVEFVAESADRVVMMAEGEVVVDGPAGPVLASSPAYAPQVSKVLGGGWLTVDQVRAAL